MENPGIQPEIHRLADAVRQAARVAEQVAPAEPNDVKAARKRAQAAARQAKWRDRQAARQAEALAEAQAAPARPARWKTPALVILSALGGALTAELLRLIGG